jgi:hypothetical protein
MAKLFGFEPSFTPCGIRSVVLGNLSIARRGSSEEESVRDHERGNHWNHMGEIVQ